MRENRLEIIKRFRLSESLRQIKTNDDDDDDDDDDCDGNDDDLFKKIYKKLSLSIPIALHKLIKSN